MDIASILGFLGAFGMVAYTMITGGGIEPFIDPASMTTVLGGTFFAVMYSHPLGAWGAGHGAMMKVFMPPIKKNEELIERMVELAAIARKDGMMALEGQDVPDKFFSKGMQMLVDGADESKLADQMNSEISAMKLRHEARQNVVKSYVDIAPAMGMVGTLIGLVFMLGNMADPKSIGPAMAIALLTTLYGALLANLMFQPMLTKLEGFTEYELVYRAMVLSGLRSIARGESPRNIQDQMIANLPAKAQEKMLGDAA